MNTEYIHLLTHLHVYFVVIPTMWLVIWYLLRTFVAKPASQQYSVSCNPLKRHKSREGNNWYQVV